MAILKSPPKPPKNETLQIRIEEELKSRLEQYAEFIGASEAYVVSEALKLVFHKDHEFKIWVESRPIMNGQEPKTVGESLFDVAEEASDQNTTNTSMLRTTRPQLTRDLRRWGPRTAQGCHELLQLRREEAFFRARHMRKNQGG